ncbi:MmgE/PrpD family protein [Compostimonas suwonensis]|uniref:2-methylcitrate dehydratase PrpD n=1 Tax=Compostimonas suwonensis TaxID=1048394 RepID=A0A2M9BCC5_9MICO|nr:MmgE/PrpD family protein [Compostimonas suwonensis]PJJ55603.1 2-methylcitrate dehydratase PrpD [Compostimonas suwonensis]
MNLSTQEATLSTELAGYFAGYADAELPQRHLHEMNRLLIDYLGVALAGSRTDSGRIAGAFAIEQGGTPQATIIGRGERTTAANAAFANAIAEHSIELDDVDVEALFHYGPPIMSTALAVGQAVGASGPRTLAAALAGCEMMNRLSRAANPSLRNRGFHTTPTTGVFGATVTAGVLLKLDAAQLVNALGLAGAQSSGLMEMYGTSMQKRFNPGPAARNGVTAAYLAGLGFTGADTIFDGVRGFAAAFTDEFDASKLTEGLGSDIPVIVEYKPYSAARPIHNAVDCALLIRNGDGVAISDIQDVVVYRHPTWADYHVINEPRTYHEAQVSLPYSVAVAFADGAALFDQYSNDRIRDDAAVMGLCRRVRIEHDPSLARGVSCHMVVTTTDGVRHEATVDYAKGSAENPLSDDELLGKFRMLAATALPGEKIEALADRARGIVDVEDINSLLELSY